jgi:hypothetical protein
MFFWGMRVLADRPVPGMRYWSVSIRVVRFDLMRWSVLVIWSSLVLLRHDPDLEGRRHDGNGLARMEHQGIEYMIRATLDPNEWTWTVYLPDGKTKQGNVRGVRARAEATAIAAIDSWLRANKPKD